MNIRIRHMLAGMATVLDVFPSGEDYRLISQRISPERRMRTRWESVGRAIQKSLDTISHESEIKEQTPEPGQSVHPSTQLGLGSNHHLRPHPTAPDSRRVR